MHHADVVVATITWARTEAEESLLCRSLQQLAALGLPVVVADRPARPPFRQRLGTMPNFRVVTPEGDGLVLQVRSALAAAADSAKPFILYTEPDKEQFFASGLHDFLARVPADCGVALAARTAAAFETFPPMQRYTESVVNELCRRVCGVAGDYTYGPFVGARDMFATHSPVDPTLGWGWRPRLFLAAQRHGATLVHVEGDYECPLDQRNEDDDERRHRLRQLYENIQGLMARPT
jgi:hypothetical protein